MKARLIISGLTLFPLTLAACTTNSPGGATSVGTGPAIAQDAMPESCQGAAATKYGIALEAISTDPAASVDGGFEVKGASDGDGATGSSRVFNCRFDSSGRFIGVMDGLAAS